jgi:hypothetical protein
VLRGVHWDTDKTDDAGLNNILLVSRAVTPCDFLCDTKLPSRNEGHYRNECPETAGKGKLLVQA